MDDSYPVFSTGFVFGDSEWMNSRGQVDGWIGNLYQSNGYFLNHYMNQWSDGILKQSWFVKRICSSILVMRGGIKSNTD